MKANHPPLQQAKELKRPSLIRSLILEACYFSMLKGARGLGSRRQPVLTMTISLNKMLAVFWTERVEKILSQLPEGSRVL